MAGAFDEGGTYHRHPARGAGKGVTTAAVCLQNPCYVLDLIPLVQKPSRATPTQFCKWIGGNRATWWA